MFNDILQKPFMGNTLQDYLIFMGVFLVGVVIVFVFKNVVMIRLRALAEKTKTTTDDFILDEFNRKIMPVIYFGVFYFSMNVLVLMPAIEKVLNIIGFLIVVISVTRFLILTIFYSIEMVWFKKKGAGGGESFKGIFTLIRVVVWSVAAVILMDNFGIKISALVAGLGISGIAIALAAQSILGDLFSYFTIFFDKPFQVGDFIIVDNYMGVVEYVGIKTTRIRSLGGEQLVFSNTDLTGSRVRNYKKMARRRVVFKFGVTYSTSLEQLKDIGAIVKKIIENVADAIFDRVHFLSYGDFSLDFEVVYNVNGGDYNKYMDIQQEINFKIKEEFEKKKIEFAFPTQTVYVNKGSG